MHPNVRKRKRVGVGSFCFLSREHSPLPSRLAPSFLFFPQLALSLDLRPSREGKKNLCPQVSLTYLVGFREPPTTIRMHPLEPDAWAFAAEIPAAALSGGALLRWAATATATATATAAGSSSPSSVRCPRRGDDWLGTAVLDPEEPSKLPLVEWFRAPISNSGGSGDWLWFDGVLRPLAAVSRKGTTSLGWPKPKLKLEFKKGYDTEDKLVVRPSFTIEGEGSPMTSVDLDSLWVRVSILRYFSGFFFRVFCFNTHKKNLNILSSKPQWEPGSNSYVRQATAFAALRSVAAVSERKEFAFEVFWEIWDFLARKKKNSRTLLSLSTLSLDPPLVFSKKAPALLTRHVVVRRNGAFYGLHALTERAGGGWLQREKLLTSPGTPKAAAPLLLL